MYRALLSAVLSLSVLLSTLVAAQDASYTFTTLDAPGSVGNTWAYGINDRGHIVGHFFDGARWHSFLTDGVTYTIIDVPGATETAALGINDNGQIVGHFVDSTGRHGFLTDGVTFTPIDVPGATSTWAFGINDNGQIVGRFSDSTGIHGFVKDGATFTPIDVPGATYTDAFGINNSGHIVGIFINTTGTHGFLTDDVTFTPIDVPGARYTQAFGINDSGYIVGNFEKGLSHGFLTDGVTFTVIDVPGATFTRAHRINTAGQIVGQFSDNVGGHGFLATPIKVDTSPPVITVAASPSALSPPNGKLVTVTVSGTITDDEPDDSGVQAGSTVYKVIDEYGQIQPKGSFTLDADGEYTFTVALQASRKGNDQDGRHYTIEVSVTDNAGNSSTELAIVTVPHDSGL